MSRKKLATAIACAVFTGAACASGVSAAEVYELNPVLVTAQRSVTKDMETPAAIEVLHADDLQKTGATSVQEALKFSTGIITHAQGPRNISQGTMTSKAVIRGVEKGTLVLIDGVPINQGGRYNLEDIPVESIDRVEVVRGGGAVLYGSEANGGVINIITKGKRANMVKAGFGNYGIQNYAASFQAGKLGFTAAYDHTGKIDHISAPTPEKGRGGAPRGLYYNIKRGEHANFNARYDFNDDLYVTHTYGRNSAHYVYKYTGIDNAANAGKEYKNVIYSTEENLTALHYTKNNFSANAFYNRRDQETKNASAAKSKDTKKPENFNPLKISHDKTSYLDQTVGINFQNRWNFHKGSFMLGYEFQRDMQDKMINKPKSVTEKFYSRNAHSLFGQVAYDFTHATQANLNFRQTWTEADAAGNKYDKFTPEFVLMHHLDENTMVYGKVGQSFMLPTFSQLYGGGNIVGVPDLKPEKGIHYELGAKKSIGKNAYRVALYSYKIEDFIDAKTTDMENITYENSDVKNTGIEIDWTRNQNENLSYRLGLTYSHPQKREGTIEHGVETKGKWHDYYGKLGFNAGIDYTRGKLTTAFNISYLGDRIRDAEPYASMKSQVFSDLNFSYKANENARFFLNIDNLFNRHDIISSASSSFYNLGRNFMAGVEYKF